MKTMIPYEYKPGEFAAFVAAMRRPQHDVVDRWWRYKFVSTLAWNKAIDVIFFGVARAVLELRLIEGLIARGVRLASVTLNEINPAHFEELSSLVERLRVTYPGVIFHLNSSRLEEFQPTGTMPKRFALVVGSQVLYYPTDHESAFLRLARELLEPDGISVITLQMPMAKASVNSNLVADHDWAPSGETVHMDMLAYFAEKAGIPFRIEFLWSTLEISSVFDDTSEHGASLLNFLVARDVRALGTEAVAQARAAVRHHSYPNPRDERQIIFPQPVGVMQAYGREAAVPPGI